MKVLDACAVGHERDGIASGVGVIVREKGEGELVSRRVSGWSRSQLVVMKGCVDPTVA